MEVHVSSPEFAGDSIRWHRIPVTRLDHDRGWIDFITPHTSKTDPETWITLLSPDLSCVYHYTFYQAGNSTPDFYINSHASHSHLFIQTMDLFCIPENLHPDAQVDITLVFPDDVTVYTPWLSANSIYSIDTYQLSHSFIVAGAYREKLITISNHSVRLVIDKQRNSTEDGSIGQSLTASFTNLLQTLPAPNFHHLLVIVQSIDGYVSQAMRRGNTIFIGIPESSSWDKEHHKKIAHELVHLFFDTEHDAAWFEESVSEYLAWITLVRSRQISQDDFYQALSEKWIQVTHSEYSGSLTDASDANREKEARNFLYSYGTLIIFAIDIELRTAPNPQTLNDLLNRLMQRSSESLVSENLLFDELTQLLDSSSIKKIKRMIDGKQDILPVFEKAGLTLKETGYTLLDIRQGPRQEYGRILSTDTLISIEYQHLDKKQLQKYLQDHLNQVVTIQLEREGVRIEQKHRIIPKVTLTPTDFRTGAVWNQILIR